ncbi:winged helix-turn-helix domain-containing protein [Candidatus Gracilibacteria bacterium]|nr:winged helix-turn-helix domain-containing protein [Candidatus Gracilibacteria bacterium]
MRRRRPGHLVNVRVTHTMLAAAIGAHRTTVIRLIRDLRTRDLLILVGTGERERFCLTPGAGERQAHRAVEEREQSSVVAHTRSCSGLESAATGGCCYLSAAQPRCINPRCIKPGILIGSPDVRVSIAREIAATKDLLVQVTRGPLGRAATTRAPCSASTGFPRRRASSARGYRARRRCTVTLILARAAVPAPPVRGSGARRTPAPRSARADHSRHEATPGFRPTGAAASRQVAPATRRRVSRELRAPTLLARESEQVVAAARRSAFGAPPELPSLRGYAVSIKRIAQHPLNSQGNQHRWRSRTQSDSQPFQAEAGACDRWRAHWYR